MFKMAFCALFTLFSSLAFAGQTSSQFQFNIKYVVSKCSHDDIYVYGCKQHTVSENVNFELANCSPLGEAQYCMAEWRHTETVDGLSFTGSVNVSEVIYPNGNTERTIVGHLQSGLASDTSSANFSIYIDSGRLDNTMLFNGVTLATPPNANRLVYTYYPTIKISSVEQ